MKEVIKKCIVTYNILALPFVPLTIYCFTPETTILSKISRFFVGWISMLAAGLAMPLQTYLIPQIVAAILIGLYVYSIFREREFFPFRWEKRSFLLLSTWTILSTLCILLGCMAMVDGVGEPLP